MRIDGEETPEFLQDKIFAFMELGINYDYLAEFWRNLRDNPSFRARRDLYAFLNKNGHPITENGCFLAYKKVRANYTDSYSGKFDNSIGTVVEMEREQVDDDPTRICSTGLHVANLNYAKSFGGERLVVCEVNPKDVVAIPVDYNQEKMRVCCYKVVSDFEELIEKPFVKVNKEVKRDWFAESMSYDKAQAIRSYARAHVTMSHRGIGDMFNVSRSVVSHVLRGSTWKQPK